MDQTQRSSQLVLVTPPNVCTGRTLFLVRDSCASMGCHWSNQWQTHAVTPYNCTWAMNGVGGWGFQSMQLPLHKHKQGSAGCHHAFARSELLLFDFKSTRYSLRNSTLLAAPCTPEAHYIFHCVNQHRAAARQHLPDCCQIHPRHLGQTIHPQVGVGGWVGGLVGGRIPAPQP